LAAFFAIRAGFVAVRRQRVQTSSFWPSMTALWRFASNRRAVWTFEWLTFEPKLADFPQIAQARGIDESPQRKRAATVSRTGKVGPS
jgi:hypothetical protein